MSDALWSWSIARARAAIARREVSPVDVVRSVLARIEERPRINAYITVLAEQALSEARDRERAVMAGEPLGPLHGIPIALKDNIATARIETTAGSGARAGWIPDQDADIVLALRKAGAVIIGKNNLFEIAFGAAHPRYGETLNPWDQGLTCGGSSSGSAAAVADGQAFGAVGTDTGGSIRIPAAMCGIVGLKVTSGLLSTRGVVPVSADLDVVGPMTRSVDDAGLLLRGMGGAVGESSVPARSLRVGMPRDEILMDLAPAVSLALEQAKRRLEEQGVQIHGIDLPDLSLSLDVMWTIASAEIAEYYRAELSERANVFCEEVRSNLVAGALIPAIDYIRARRLRQLIRARTIEAFAGVDAVLLPSLPIAPYPSGAQRITLNGAQHKVLPVIMRFTPLANVTGQPAIIVPLASPEQRPPATVQLYGRHQDEGTLLRIARIIERDQEVPFPD